MKRYQMDKYQSALVSTRVKHIMLKELHEVKIKFDCRAGLLKGLNPNDDKAENLGIQLELKANQLASKRMAKILKEIK